VSPVRVAARRPGSRLAARSGDGPGRSPASKALLGERLSGPQREAKPAASLVPARLGGRGGAEPVEVRVKALEGAKSLECGPEGPPGVWGVERSEGGGGNWGGPPRPDGLRVVPPERRAL
jgi:hypothetical protein